MRLTAAIVIGGAAVYVRHPSDAFVAMKHMPGLAAHLLDEDGAVLKTSADPEEVWNWPERDDRSSRYESTAAPELLEAARHALAALTAAAPVAPHVNTQFALDQLRRAIDLAEGSR